MKKKLREEWKNIIFNFIFAFLTLLLVILFKDKIILATGLLLILMVVGMFKWKSQITLILFFFVGFFGTFAEVFAISYGVWNYAFINFLNVPLWLFVVWGNAAASIYQTALEIKKFGVKK